MPQIAAWLVARPERAVFILIATFPLPFTQILGSAVLVLLVLSGGLARAAQVAGIAFGAILVLTLVTSVPAATLFQVALTIWVPGILLALLLQRTKSLTLLLQMMVLAALVATTPALARLFLAALGEPSLIVVGSIFLVSNGLIVLVAWYDANRNHRLHPIFLYGGLGILLVRIVRVPFAMSPTWRETAQFIATFAS